MRFGITFLVVLVCLSFGEIEAISLYETLGTEITCTASWFFLSGSASMRAVERTNLQGREVILWRGKVDRPGGILGFIINLFKAYKGATIFDSYIDIETHLPLKSVEYRTKKDGGKTILEHIVYDREKYSLTSLVKDTILIGVPFDTKDGVSTLIDFLYRANIDKMDVGEILRADMNAGVEISEVVVEVTGIEKTQRGILYTFTSKKLPDVLKYQTVLDVQLLDDGERRLPVSGVGTVWIPIIGKIRIKGILTTSGI